MSLLAATAENKEMTDSFSLESIYLTSVLKKEDAASFLSPTCQHRSKDSKAAPVPLTRAHHPFYQDVSYTQKRFWENVATSLYHALFFL